MTQQNDIPSWMSKSEQYEASSDSIRFRDKTEKTMIHILSTIRRLGEPTTRRGNKISICPAFWLVGTLLMIIYISLSTSVLYLWIVGAIVLVLIALMRGNEIARVLAMAFPPALLTVILMLPMLFMGNAVSLVRLPVKVFLSVAIVGIMTTQVAFNQLTNALRAFHIPNLFILILDMTVKYIVLLGEICLHMMEALKVRTIGRVRGKAKAAGGILGMTFLKSKDMSDDMMDAMTARGFDGTYYGKWNFKWNLWNVLYIIGVVALGVTCYLL